MKKFLGIIVLGLLLSGNAYAENRLIGYFNEWLNNNGHHQYLDKENCPPQFYYQLSREIRLLLLIETR